MVARDSRHTSLPCFICYEMRTKPDLQQKTVVSDEDAQLFFLNWASVFIFYKWPQNVFGHRPHLNIENHCIRY